MTPERLAVSHDINGVDDLHGMLPDEIMAALAAERARADTAEQDLATSRELRAYTAKRLVAAEQERDQFRAQRDAAVAALRTVTESVFAPWTAGGFVCCGCGEWGETRATIRHEACWLSDEARAILQAADQRGGEVGP